ncbi:MAG: alpha/beta hydrolase [Acidisphaera sp.]|nr:alpha/beta hydrolase [Acidisphaera sp.]
MRGVTLALVAALFAAPSGASTVGERHLTAVEDSAAARDAHGDNHLRITVWYPADPGATEKAIAIGPPAAPLFLSGAAAPDAPFADSERRPVVLLSHGFGGTARMMAWFGTALAREGYLVIAVDHPGNNGADPMTVAGAALFWERPRDLAAALARVGADAEIAPHLDASRLGVAGFSAGGFTALAASGGRVDIQRLLDFCQANPTDGACQPQQEFSMTFAQASAFMAEPRMAGELARSRGDLGVPGVKAAFAIAPGIIPSFDPASLASLHVPVSIILGDADRVAPPGTNGEVAARLVPGAQLRVLSGVGHYDFLADCTPAGNAAVAVCPTKIPRPTTHKAAIEDALDLFNRALAPSAR